MNEARKVLIVGEDRNAVNNIRIYLRGKYEVSVSNVSNMLFEETGNNQPDIMILYVEKEALESISIFDEFNAHSEFRDIPIILIASQSDYGKLKEKVNIALVDFLVRPVDNGDITASIMRYCQSNGGRALTHKPTVLAIDDDAMSLRLMQQYLCEEYNVITIDNGREAIRHLYNNAVDLIILDVEMPEMDGYTTYEGIRKIPTCVKTPVIFSSGHMEKDTIMKCISLGCTDYILKPVKKDEALDKLSKVLDKENIRKERKNILVVDDDKEYLKILSTYLQNDYYVSVVNSGRLAMEYLSKHSPDLILLDYQMPLHNGPSVLNMIRGREESKNIPVIFLTGIADKDTVLECMSMRPAGYMVKPVVKRDLLQRIKEILYED